MNQQTQPPPREHHFYVAHAKFLFHHSRHGIVAVRDPIKLKDAEQYGLTPLILYGLRVAGLPICWMTFSPANQPRSFREVLLDAWSNAAGLRGYPDVLKVSRHVSMASPALINDMASIGVEVKVADPKDKSFPASLRSAQNASMWLLEKHAEADRPIALAVRALCQDAQREHSLQNKLGLYFVSNSEIAGQINEWLALPMREVTFSHEKELDWVVGSWLSSWEANLPPAAARYFTIGRDGVPWLLTGALAQSESSEDAGWSNGQFDNLPEITKNLVACWPNPPAQLAKHLGITLRELQWFTSEKSTLSQQTLNALVELLGIENDSDLLDPPFHMAHGPYVLMAKKPQALQEIYESMSHGGDASPCELIPHQGPADPSWRYVLINPFDSPPSILMAPRGAKISDRLPDLLMNYSGVRVVSSELYRDVVSTCARACGHPTANNDEMHAFAERHKFGWSSCCWHPGEMG